MWIANELPEGVVRDKPKGKSSPTGTSVGTRYLSTFPNWKVAGSGSLNLCRPGWLVQD
jgi:hypothetical protein